MNLNRKLELLESKIRQANDDRPADFEQWKRSSEVVIRTVMGIESLQLKNFNRVRYSPSVYYSGMDTRGYQSTGVKKAINILRACQEELQLVEEFSVVEGSGTLEITDAGSASVLIVHGQNGETKYEVARVVESLVDHAPTILHEQANGGRTIIEKFEKAASVPGFALVLPTADDLGRSQSDDVDRPRARQNVVFELGFFFGLLGRERTAVLYDSGVELPGDISGLVYIEHDRAGA